MSSYVYGQLVQGQTKKLKDLVSGLFPTLPHRFPHSKRLAIGLLYSELVVTSTFKLGEPIKVLELTTKSSRSLDILKLLTNDLNTFTKEHYVFSFVSDDNSILAIFNKRDYNFTLGKASGGIFSEYSNGFFLPLSDSELLVLSKNLKSLAGANIKYKQY